MLHYIRKMKKEEEKERWRKKKRNRSVEKCAKEKLNYN